MRKISWEEVLELSDSLANKIKKSGFEIDLLVGLSRGGWVPTRLLSDRLRVKKIASIGITYEDTARTILSAYSLPSPVVPGQKILLIEDRLESAKSMKKAIEILTDQGAVVETACFFIMSKSIIKPNYYLDLIDDTVVFPWE